MDRPLLDLSLMVELNATGTCYGLMLNGTVGHCGHIA